MTIPQVTTSRLLLRGFTEADVPELYTILMQPDILRYFPPSTPPSHEKAEKLVRREQRHWDEVGYGWWAVERNDAPGLLGWMGLGYLPETDETEVAYLLRREVWGRGLATEGARAALAFGFEHFDFPLIIGLTHPENIASQRVLQKSGLRFVAEAVYFGMTCRRYVLQRADWREASLAQAHLRPDD
jgi:ribosomal-protein-alanine N-acetyltransferase